MLRHGQLLLPGAGLVLRDEPGVGDGRGREGVLHEGRDEGFLLHEVSAGS